MEALSGGRVLQATEQGTPLGTLVYRAGLLRAEQIEQALAEGVRTGRRLGEILVERGWVGESHIALLLAKQKGLEFVRLGEQVLDPKAVGLLAKDAAVRHRALPVRFDGTAVVVALADPASEEIRDFVGGVLGREVRFVVVTQSDLSHALARAYAEPADGDGAEAVPLTPELALVPGKEAAAPTSSFVQEAAPPRPAAPEAAPAPRVVEEPAPASPVVEIAPLARPVAEEPRPAPVPVAQAEPEPEPKEAATATLVVVRTTGGEGVVAGVFPDAPAAEAAARSLIAEIDAAGGRSWPLVNGRFLRPETVVSVDLVGG